MYSHVQLFTRCQLLAVLGYNTDACYYFLNMYVFPGISLLLLLLLGVSPPFSPKYGPILFLQDLTQQ